jgi:hypothetical protein
MKPSLFEKVNISFVRVSRQRLNRSIDVTRLIPEKLHVKYLHETKPDAPTTSRFYTLTHSDSTGDLFLSIGPTYDKKQISGLYTRLMRDEVLAELKKDSDGLLLNVHCHISGGFVFGRAKWRYNIFCSELSLALEAIRFGDKALFDNDPKLDEIPVSVHFKSADKKYEKTEKWGKLGDYKL